MGILRRIKRLLWDESAPEEVCFEQQTSIDEPEPAVPEPAEPAPAPVAARSAREVPAEEKRLKDLVSAAEAGAAAPVSSELVLQLVSSMVSNGRARRAVELLSRLTTRVPTLVVLRLHLAELLYDLRALEDAVELLSELTQELGASGLRQGTELHTRAHFLLGEFHAGEGNHSTALRHYESVLALDFKYPRVRGRAEALRRKLDRPVATAAPTIFGAEDLGPGGRFTLQRELGRGGGGTVYLALDQSLGRPVAVKVLHPHVARRQDARAHLFCEARIAAALRHPRIVTVYDLLESLNLVVMEFCSGGALSDAIAGTPLPPVKALRRLAEITRVLDTVHRCGVVHRDLKPGNLLLRGNARNEALVLTDFGTAHAATEEGEEAADQNAVGSLIYMAPEQRQVGTADARADLYACGVILMEMLRGHPPLSQQQAIAGTSVLELSDLWRELAEEHPPGVVALCRELVSTAPDQRPASASEVTARAEELAASIDEQMLRAEAQELARMRSG
jgi:hypothetical protein